VIKIKYYSSELALVSVTLVADGLVLLLSDGVGDGVVTLFVLGARDVHVLRLFDHVSLCDVVRFVLRHCDVVLLDFCFRDVVRFLHCLVVLLGHRHVVRDLSSEGTVVRLRHGLHEVVGSRHVLVLGLYLHLVDLGSVVGNLGLVDDLIRQRLRDELVLHDGGRVVQGLRYVLVQGVRDQLIIGVPVDVALHGGGSVGLVVNLVVALLRALVDGLGRGTVGRGGGRAVGRGWGAVRGLGGRPI